MHFNSLSILAFAAGAAAFPAVSSDVDKRALSSKTETNAGIFPNKGFDEKDQFVDVRPGSGHEFVAPKKGDIRGPCPGLNAAANHGFISHTGVLDYHDTTEGLYQAYSLGQDFSNVLFVFSIFNSGSLLNLKWSIGGPMKSTTLGLLGPGLGISNSHNKYEGDSSTGRGDAFLHDGDAHSLIIPNFQNLLHHAGEKDDFDFESNRKHLVFAHEFTIQNNPYAFYGPTFFISPIAHQFVTAFMSNHSAEHVGGVLPKNVLKSFFSVKEHKDGTLEWIPGHDSIPENWYKRPTHNPYGIAASFGDLGLSIAENLEIADIGGNLGKPNTFAGVEIENLSGGLFNAKDLLKGNNLACFALQGLVFFTPGVLSKLTEIATSSFDKLANKVLGEKLSELGCPELSKMQYDMEAFNKFPGYTWKQPLQPATPY